MRVYDGLIQSLVDMFVALHELDPAYRAVTLENDKLKSLVRDLNFHEDPRGID